MTGRIRAGLAGLALLLCGSFAIAQEGQDAGAASGQAADETPFDLGAWITRFHESPDPDRVAFVIREMSRQGFYGKRGPVATAFLAEVFRTHPGRVAEWSRAVEGLPTDDRHWIYLAIWWSEVPESRKLLEAAAKKETGNLAKALEKYLASEPGPILEMPLDRPVRLDMLWVSYFASGKRAYVERLTTALVLPEEPPPEVAQVLIQGAARWSLTSNARQHDDVRRILVELRDGAAGALRKELDGILERSKPDATEEGGGEERDGNGD